eukprot:58877-Chlamydomonas_euryale.AAC.4
MLVCAATPATPATLTSASERLRPSYIGNRMPTWAMPNMDGVSPLYRPVVKRCENVWKGVGVDLEGAAGGWGRMLHLCEQACKL